jgi:hypothetical protein
MTTYIALIYGDETTWDSWTEEQAQANGEAHGAFNARHGHAVVGGHELERSRDGRSISADPAGGTRVTDGAFRGATTVLGGFYLLQAASLDEAVSIASDLPEASAPGSGVEVRPLART